MVTSTYREKFIVIVFLLLAVILTASVFGSADIGITDFFKTLINAIPGFGDLFDVPKSHHVIIFNLRLPRILMALFAGAGLAIAGTVFQAVFSNPMADPYLLGVSSGAAFGATLATVLNIQVWILSFGTVSIFAFIGAMAVVLLIYRMTIVKGSLTISVLLLSGLAINYLLSALVTLIMTFNNDKLEAVYFWTQGSFRSSTWEKLAVVMIVVLICSIYIYRYRDELDMIMMGDEQAKSVGVDVQKLKKRMLMISSLAAAMIVSATGIIGFVGLITPHAMRMIAGPKHRRLLPLTWLSGGIFLIICDTIARTVLVNKELSIGIITSICGVPFFLWLLYKNRKGMA